MPAAERAVTLTAEALQFASVRGARLGYRFDGPPGAPVVMLSNSLMSTHAMWQPQMTALTGRWRVLRYDTRGHGASEVTPAPYSIESLADDAAALLDALKIPAVHFVGLSKGGMIGQQLAVRHPQRVRSLVLADTASEMPPLAMWEERLAIARRDGIAGLVEGTLKRWFCAGFAERAPQTIAAVRAMILTTPVEGYVGCASAVRDMSQTRILKSIKAPTLVVVGEQDPACTVAQARVLARAIPGARLEVIPDAAHLANIEQPEQFNRLLLDFLKNQET